jgi:AAA domain, putative AbiEii toxin, Type IV TA system
MIHLRSIELTNFKGVSKLRCDFDDFTVLAGLNNSGKTTVLQGVYLLFASLPRVTEHAHIYHANPAVRTISLQNALPPLGLRDTTWLFSSFAPEVTGTIVGEFVNGVRLELGIIRNATSNLTFAVSHPEASQNNDSIRPFLVALANISASILTPPGDVSTRETMVNGDQYQNLLREGQGAQLWRNGLWWAIQADGFESFDPVQQQIVKYFPDVELLLPTLGATGTPEILIKYKESGRGPLDIAQSGAGLRTFISLARILEQSSAKVILLDEPDAHLHASQQAVILDLMLDAAATADRQVIIASHSPEIISRVPAECLRWIEKGNSTANSGYDIGRILEHLGVSADMYIPRSELPDVLVYVEGVEDRPIIEALIKWCRKHAVGTLPTTLVIPHRDGRFDGPTLQGIVRFTRAINQKTAVVGVRDLDWYYSELPASEPTTETGDGWTLINVPCKEMENLFCEVPILFRAYDEAISHDDLKMIVDEESANAELVDDWCYQVRPRVRGRMSKSLDESTKERQAEEIFLKWRSDPDLRRRLVAGKGLLRKVRHRIRTERMKSFHPIRVFEKIAELTTPLQSIAKSIFPNQGTFWAELR